jgi:hypothetical protein
MTYARDGAQLKKHAKPYKFLKFERKWIYPVVVKDYHEEMDLSSDGGKKPPHPTPLPYPLPALDCCIECIVGSVVFVFGV